MKSNQTRWLHRLRGTMTGLAILLTACFAAPSAFASPIPMSSVLIQYALVSVGSGATLMVNSGPITGKVLIGDGSNATSAGGGHGQITGGLDISPPVSGDNLQSLATKPTITLVSPTIGTTAFSDAATLSSTVAGLTPTQTFGSISGTQTITGNGGLNVINVTSLSNPTLTLRGTANDIFVFNVANSFSTNRVMTLTGGLTPDHILWNFTGGGTTVFSTSGGNLLYGTFLATSAGARFQFSSLDLTGQLINTGDHIQFVSNSSMTGAPFTTVPEPNSGLLMASGLMLGLLGIGTMTKKKMDALT